MTPDLISRLKRSMPPFDGDCVYNTTELNLTQLRVLVNAAILSLQPQTPIVCSFHDWHEHDGFVVEATPCSWSRIHASLVTDRTLFESRAGDFGVRVAIQSPTFDWLLRYNIDDEEESDFTTAICDFDLCTAEDSPVNELAGTLMSTFPDVLRRTPAAAWLRSRSVGD